VRLSTNDGLPAECVLKPEWIRIVERRHIGSLIATLPDDRWSEVRAALLNVLGFET
jgi:mRNA-degrading endonuclease toxin of MazEF toxin-antitoxin module